MNNLKALFTKKCASFGDALGFYGGLVVAF
jgi:hypothetical protein